VLEALIQAGGVTGDAADDIKIIRTQPRSLANGLSASDDVPETQIMVVSYAALSAGQVSDKLATLQDGDQIVVDKAQAVTIMGAVNSQGAYHVEPGTTVRTALALAGGVNERGSTKNIQILRNAKQLKGVTLETIVKPGDTITVRNRAL
jgi:protein involved in polysaccharide export with SLBB domain